MKDERFKGRGGKTAGRDELDDVVRRLRSAGPKEPGYRELSLKIHGLICAKCGREFDWANRHLLTVHHKDGNHNNNPKDGSNWENLCIYCHEDEHSRGLLADLLSDKGKKRPD
ncbi:MAG: YajD family HNH nuclease [Desulfobacteraceae bacterium]